MPDVSFESLLIVGVAVAVPLLLGTAPGLRIPSVVLEILVGVLVGPSVAGDRDHSRPAPGQPRPGPPAVADYYPIVYAQQQILPSARVDTSANTVTLPLHQGRLQDGRIVWFVVTDASDQQWARHYHANHSPKLGNAPASAVRTATMVGGTLVFDRGTVDCNQQRFAPDPLYNPTQVSFTPDGGKLVVSIKDGPDPALAPGTEATGPDRSTSRLSRLRNASWDVSDGAVAGFVVMSDGAPEHDVAAIAGIRGRWRACRPRRPGWFASRSTPPRSRSPGQAWPGR